MALITIKFELQKKEETPFSTPMVVIIPQTIAYFAAIIDIILKNGKVVALANHIMKGYSFNFLCTYQFQPEAGLGWRGRGGGGRPRGI